MYHDRFMIKYCDQNVYVTRIKHLITAALLNGIYGKRELIEVTESR